MTRPKRDQAVRAFMSKGKAKVMLMSMKCGGGCAFFTTDILSNRVPGVGLNLTRANNVMALDLGWSQAIENQAFDRWVEKVSFLACRAQAYMHICRVHRLG